MEEINKCIIDIGDELSKEKGNNVRPPGKVENPVTLTKFDKNHPYYMSMYDLSDTG